MYTSYARYNLHGDSEDHRAARAYLSRYSGKTLETLGYTLKVFFRWCAVEGIKPLSCTREDIERYIRNEEARGLKSSTVNHKLINLNNFYDLCVEDEYIAKNPMRKVRRPKHYTERSKLVAVNRVMLARLLEAAHKSGYPVDRGIIALMGMLGLRLTEATHLRVEDCHHMSRGHRTIRFVGKGNKPAELPVSIFVARELDFVIGDRTSGYVLEHADHEIRKGWNRHYSQHAVQSAINRMCYIAGIEQHISPHMLRHGFVTAALDAGASLWEVQQAARHEDPKTTMIYAAAKDGFDAHAAYRVSSFIAGAM